MRFLPALALLADGPVRFDGDEQAYARPMGSVAGCARRAGRQGGRSTAERCPSPSLAGPGQRSVTFDASGSSQFVSALLMVGARLPGGLDVRHSGPPVPSLPHIEMTVAMLRERHVRIDYYEPDRWLVHPGPMAPHDETIEPDLSNAAPFPGGRGRSPEGAVTVPHWPGSTQQPGDAITGILSAFGAEASFDEHGPDGTRHRPSAWDRPRPVRRPASSRRWSPPWPPWPTAPPICAASPTSAATRLIGWPHWPPSWSGWVVTYR